MATYGTDLVTLSTAESGTWTEFTDAASGGTPSLDGENFIQGTDCYSQATGTKSGLKSVVLDTGANQSGNITTGKVVLAWLYYAVGSNLTTYASNGYRFGIGTSVANVDLWTIGGSNFGKNPYGGWFNVAVDPRATVGSTFGTGSGGSWQFFGGVVDTINAISKGTPHAVDAIRYGRGIIYCTGTGCEFNTMAEYNDYNSATNHPNGTGPDGGYNRLGLFSSQGGTFLWKGLLSIGQTGTSCTFSDANKTIVIDDTPAVTSTFNAIEIHHASTSCTWNSITFLSLGTTSKGSFTCVDDATVNLLSCTFTDMSDFIFKSNTTSNGTVYRRCGTITANSASLIDSSFINSTAASSVLWNTAVETDGKLDGCVFTSDGSNHAIEFTAFDADNSITLRNCTFTNYAAANGSTGNETIYINIASGTFTIYAVNCSGNISIRTAGATVTVEADPVTIKVIAKTDLGVVLSGARVFLRTAEAGTLPFNASVSISNSGTTATVTHTAHGLKTNDKIVIYNASNNENLGVHQITVTDANTYTYTTPSLTASDSGNAYFVYVEGLTDVNGEISNSRVLSTTQASTGTIRKASSAPFYKPSPISGDISSTENTTFTGVMIPD